MNPDSYEEEIREASAAIIREARLAREAQQREAEAERRQAELQEETLRVEAQEAEAEKREAEISKAELGEQKGFKKKFLEALKKANEKTKCWLATRREHPFKPIWHNADPSGYGSFIVLGLLVWLIQIFYYRFGSISPSGPAWILLNAFVAIICAFFTPAPIQHIGLMFFLQVLIIPWGAPYLQSALASLLRANQSASVQLMISLFTVPGFWPVWLLYGLKHSHSRHAKRLLNFYVFIIALVLIFGMGELLYNVGLPKAPNVAFEPRTIMSGFVDIAKKLAKGLVEFTNFGKRWVEYEINEATGGLYEARVEKNKDGPLGVTIEKLIPAAPIFFADPPEDIIVWGSIYGRSVSRNISVNLSCWAGSGDEKVKGEIRPSASTKIDIEGIKDFECVFKQGTLKPGTHTITVAAEFDFRTEAYRKVYFMEQAKLVPLLREGVNPLDSLKITDKTPRAVYTDGPIMLSLSTTQDLIGIESGDKSQPFTSLSMLVSNKWEGRLKAIKNLELSIPSTLGLDTTRCYPSFENGGVANSGDRDSDRKYYRLANPITDRLEQDRIFRCFFQVLDPGTILGGKPVASLYMRLTADYTYEVSSSVSIKIQEPEKKESEGDASGEGEGASGGDSSGEGEGATDGDSPRPEGTQEGGEAPEG